MIDLLGTVRGGLEMFLADDETGHLRAARFGVVEVDATYYALPAERTAQLWAERTPPDFTFDIKAHALMTGQVVAAIHWQALRLWLSSPPHRANLADEGGEQADDGVADAALAGDGHEPDPALEPPEPSSSSQGLLVRPPYQTSFSASRVAGVALLLAGTYLVVR